MRVKVNKRYVTINDEWIKRTCKKLDLTQEEAVQMWLEDNGYQTNQEQEALDKKASAVKQPNASTDKPKDSKPKSKTSREPKRYPVKEKLITEIAEFLQTLEQTQEVQIINISKLISFSVGEDNFEIDLKQKRKPKQ